MSAEAWRDRGHEPAAVPRPTPPGGRTEAERVNDARLLTAEDLAARWQVPHGQVYRLAREGKLPVVQLGRYRRFRLVEIEAFEASGGVPADA